MTGWGVLYDAIHPADIPPGRTMVAGYLDGPDSAWPAGAWDAFAGCGVIRGSVLGDPAADWLDCEAGDAGPVTVAQAAAIRAGRRQATIVYTTRARLAALGQALAAKSLRLAPASEWPAPGVYLWLADPTGTAHLVVAGVSPQPLAVQHTWTAGYDISAVWPGVVLPAWPRTPPPPAPDPPQASPGGAPTTNQEDPMADLIIRNSESGAAFAWIGGRRVPIPDEATLAAYQAAGIPRADVTAAGFADALGTLP